MPRSVQPQFSFWPQSGATPTALPDYSVAPSGRQASLPGSTKQAHMSAQVPAPPTAGTPVWPGSLTGTPQQCGDTLLRMLSSPEGQLLSPELRFALGSAIRSAQYSLVDPNAEFTEPLSPPVWHTAPDASAAPDVSMVGFGWLNTTSHFVSSTPPVLPAQAITATPVNPPVLADVEMHDVVELPVPAGPNALQAPGGGHDGPGLPRSSRPSACASCHSLSPSPLQQQSSTAPAAVRSPPLALLQAPQSDCPVSPLSVSGLPPGPTDQAVSEGSAPAAPSPGAPSPGAPSPAAPSPGAPSPAEPSPAEPLPVEIPKPHAGQVSFGTRLGVSMYESPESTRNTADWEVTQDAGATPFMACLGASPAHSISAQLTCSLPRPLQGSDIDASRGLHESGQPAACTVRSPFMHGKGTEAQTASVSGNNEFCAHTPISSHMPSWQPETTRTDEVDGVPDNHAEVIGDPGQHLSAQGEPYAAVPGDGRAAATADVCDDQGCLAGTAGSPSQCLQDKMSTGATMIPIMESQGETMPSAKVTGRSSEELDHGMLSSGAGENAAVPQACLLSVSQHAPNAGVVHLTASPSLVTPPSNPAGPPAVARQARADAATPSTASVGAVSLPPTACEPAATPLPHQGMAWLNSTTLELPPCSQLAQAGTPHPTPTATATPTVRPQAAVSMLALRHAMLSAGLMASSTDLAASSPTAASVHSPVLVAAEAMMSCCTRADETTGGTPGACIAPVVDTMMGKAPSPDVPCLKTLQLSARVLGETPARPTLLHAGGTSQTHEALALMQTPLTGVCPAGPTWCF